MAAAWLSPPSSLTFPLSGGIFEAFPHRTILCARKWVLNPPLSRDGPHELLGLLWPLPSGFDDAVVSRFAVSRGRLLTGCSEGPPRTPSRFLRRAVLAHAPPSPEISPRRWRNLRRDRTRVPSSIAAGPTVELPRHRVNQLVGRCASLRRHRWVAPICPWFPQEPLLLPNLLLTSVRWVPEPTSPARIHSRKVAPPSASRCHPSRSFRPRGSIPTSAVYSARWFPGCCTWYRL